MTLAYAILSVDNFYAPRMGLSDITRPAVLDAMAEFDRLGREVFLDTYRFGRALSYFVEIDGKLYDSKAIAGYAHGQVPRVIAF